MQLFSGFHVGSSTASPTSPSELVVKFCSITGVCGILISFSHLIKQDTDGTVICLHRYALHGLCVCVCERTVPIYHNLRLNLIAFDVIHIINNNTALNKLNI